jgi:hypothetical protein
MLGILIGNISAQASLLLEYKFDQVGAVQESSGEKSLNMTTYNASAVATNYVTAAPGVPGGGTNALNLTSENVNPSGVDNLQGDAQAALNNTNASFLRNDLKSFTISAWVMNDYTFNTTLNASRRVFSLRDSSASKGVVELLISNTNVSVSLTGSGGSQIFSTPLTVPANNSTWYFLSVTYDDTTGALKVYSGAEGETLNLYTGQNSTTGTLLTSANLLAIGNAGYNQDRRFDGYISDVRFYDEVLDNTQIQQLYAAVPEPTVGAALGVAGFFAVVYRFLGTKEKRSVMALAVASVQKP